MTGKTFCITRIQPTSFNQSADGDSLYEIYQNKISCSEAII